MSAFLIQKVHGEYPPHLVAKRVKDFMTIDTGNFIHFWQSYKWNLYLGQLFMKIQAFI